MWKLKNYLLKVKKWLSGIEKDVGVGGKWWVDMINECCMHVWNDHNKHIN
jgi:hypothetical protein